MPRSPRVCSRTALLVTVLVGAGCHPGSDREDALDPEHDAGLSDDRPRAPSLNIDAAVTARIDAARAAPTTLRGELLFAAVDDAGAPDAESPRVALDGPTTVLVVFDKSGSMGVGWSDGETRWTAANKALIAALAPAQEQLTIGAILFPQPDACLVAELSEPGQFAFARGPQFIDQWKRTIERDGVSGSTPLERSLRAADNAISQFQTPLGQSFIVLVITDGEPTCGDNVEALVSLPAAWLTRGIKTHVMGLPGSEAAAQLLDRIAKAGGSDKHQAIGSPGELETAVIAIL
jgi:Mg-chelatase subunit ChlD